MAERSAALEILDAGPLATVQDLGRPGTPTSACPVRRARRPAHRLANRLVGNAESEATVECLGGRLSRSGRAAP